MMEDEIREFVRRRNNKERLRAMCRIFIGDGNENYKRSQRESDQED